MMDQRGTTRRLMLKGIAAGLCVGWLPVAVGKEQALFGELPKALWVWLKSLDELPELSAFALEHRFSALMIHFRKTARPLLLDPGSPSVPILRNLKKQGCAIYALAGEPEWAAHDRLPRTIEQLLAVQQRHEVFEGLHLDVEPHSLPRWREPGGRAELMTGIATLAKRTRDAMPSKLSLQMAVNPKHATERFEDNDLLGLLKPHVQEVALMAYRDTPQKQREAARVAIARLNELDLPWRMGVLSNPPKKEYGVSYHGLRRDAFETQMQSLWHLVRSDPLCRGLIFENYHSLRNVLRA